MANLSALFAKYDRLVLFDTETTGLLYNRDEIIEFAAVVVEQQARGLRIEEHQPVIFFKQSGKFCHCLSPSDCHSEPILFCENLHV